MVMFIYCYGARKPGQTGRFVHAYARQVKDCISYDRALYTLYDSLRGQGYFPIVTPKKNGVRVVYTQKRGKHHEESKD